MIAAHPDGVPLHLRITIGPEAGSESAARPARTVAAITTLLLEGAPPVEETWEESGADDADDADLVSACAARCVVATLAADDRSVLHALVSARPALARESALAVAAQRGGIPAALLLGTVKDRDAAPGLRRLAVEALARAEPDPAAVATLAALLVDFSDSALARRAAAFALGSSADANPASERALAQALGDQDVALRRSAAAALAARNPSQVSLRPLMEALKDDDWLVRSSAAEALGKLGAEGGPAVGALAAALRDDQVALRLRAAQALGAIGPAARSAAPALAARVGDEREDEAVRAFATQALGRLGPQAAPALVRILRRAEPHLRELAARALAATGAPPEQIVPALTAALHDEDPWVAIAAASTLGALGGAAETITRLTSLRDDADPEVSEAAGRILDAIEPAPAAPTVAAAPPAEAPPAPSPPRRTAAATGTQAPLSWAAPDHPGDAVPQSAAPLLAEVVPMTPPEPPAAPAPEYAPVPEETRPAEPPAAVPTPPLTREPTEPETVRPAAQETAEPPPDLPEPRIGPSLMALLEALRDRQSPGRRASAERVLRDAAPAWLGELEEAARHPDPEVRVAAVRAFQLAGPAAGDVLARTLTEDPEPRVRWSAATALGEGAYANQPTVGALAQALRDEDSRVRLHAAQALAHIGPGAAPAAGALANVLGASGEGAALRRKCAQALGAMGPAAAAAVPALIAALRDEDRWIRRYAAEALGAMGGAAAQAAPALRYLISGESEEDVAAAALRALQSIQQGPELSLRRSGVSGAPNHRRALPFHRP